MAELFLARDVRTNELVVIKRILPYLSNEPDFVQMFLDEARIAAQLHHQNVIEVFELGQLEESIFISMEYVDGVDLRKVLGEEQRHARGVPYGIAAWICAQVCDGLYYAHNGVGLNGIPLQLIHRDVSPQNVMVGYDGRIKLVDFGIAKAHAFMERSKPGVIKGKFLYLAPEQLTQERLDHRADLFAVGTMLYEVTTGKSPFYKNTTEAVILAIRNEDPAPPHLIVPGYPAELSRIVMKCLTRDRNRRYQQAEEISSDLGNFLARSEPTDQRQVANYIAELLGDEGERTVLHIPGQLLQNEPLFGQPLLLGALSPRAAEDPTASMPNLAPGRRVTGEQAAADAWSEFEASSEEDGQTLMALREDLREAAGSAIAPSFSSPPVRRPTAHGYQAAGAPAHPDATSTNTGGAEPSRSVTSPARTLTPSTAPVRVAKGGARPSAKLAAARQDEPVFDALPSSKEPLTLAEGARGNRRRSGSNPRPLQGPTDAPLGDPGDDESTAGYSGASDPHGTLSPARRWQRLATAGGLLALVVVGTALALWSLRPDAPALPPEEAEPSAVVEEAQPKEPEQELTVGAVQVRPEGQAQPEPTAAVIAAPAADKLKVIFAAPRGTAISIAKRSFVPRRQYELAAGSHRVLYRCPKGMRGSGYKVQVVAPVKEGPQQLTSPCKRK